MATTIDLTQILIAILTLLFGLLTRYVIPAIKDKTSADQMELLRVAVKTAVYAAEQLYGSNAGQAKLQYVINLLAEQGHFCTPMVDWRGEFHASESWLCQSFGNVNRDDRDTLFDSLARGRPCGRCAGGRRYLSEDTPKMAMARRLLGQPRITFDAAKEKEACA